MRAALAHGGLRVSGRARHRQSRAGGPAEGGRPLTISRSRSAFSRRRNSSLRGQSRRHRVLRRVVAVRGAAPGARRARRRSARGPRGSPARRAGCECRGSARRHGARVAARLDADGGLQWAFAAARGSTSKVAASCRIATPRRPISPTCAARPRRGARSRSQPRAATACLMIGPPGAGKSMLAQRLPGLLPALDDDAKRSNARCCIRWVADLPPVAEWRRRAVSRAAPRRLRGGRDRRRRAAAAGRDLARASRRAVSRRVAGVPPRRARGAARAARDRQRQHRARRLARATFRRASSSSPR